MSEEVLVIPTAALREAGLFQGLSDRVEYYLPRLLRSGLLRYLPRDAAELDPEHKQLIPYVVLRHQGRLFHYRRGGGEARLHARRSVGIGGHIATVDGEVGAEAYRAGMLRELAEEVDIAGPYQEKCIGLINDDSTPVGQVHLGIVHLLELADGRVSSREAALADGGLAAPAELRGDLEAFETWSRLLLEGRWLG